MKGRVDLQTTRGFQHHDGNQLVHMLVKLLFHLPPQVFELKMKNQKKIGNHQGNWSKIYTFETKISSQKNTTKTPKCRAKAVLFGILF